jgi:DNA-binding CsgD family transcriptional regulator
MTIAALQPAGISPFVDAWIKERVSSGLARRDLTAAERVEVHRMALGTSAKLAAERAGLSHETIRARRKRIYLALRVEGHNELLAAMLTDAVLEARPR